MNKRNEIRMQGICKNFFEARALDEVDFSCRSGEVHALVGLNGAGKSTLMKVLGGVIQRDAGTIELNGAPVDISGPAAAGDIGLSMIHQEFSLIGELSVAGNIFLGRELRYPGTPFVNLKEMARRVRDQLTRFDLDLDPYKPVRELNSGEKQIVEIIRALMSDSWLIVMDEPTSALSEGDKKRLFGFIDRMREEGVSIIYISHHMPEIFGIADRVTVMRDGRIVLSEKIDGTREADVIREMTGRELEDFVKPHKQQTGDVLLSVRDLTLEGAFEKISLDVHCGEIVVLTGLRGCGGPELSKAVFGLEGGYDGQVVYRGETLRPGRGPVTAIREGMGLVTENRDKNGILAPLSVRDNIALPYLEKFVSNGLVSRAKVERVVASAMSATSTKASSPDQEIRFLSGGNKQKICFSRWLDPDLELLILLEPTRGIDVHAKADIYRIIEDLAERGVGVLVLSYEIDEVIMIADRVLTLYEGRAVGEYRYPKFDKELMLGDMAGAASARP